MTKLEIQKIRGTMDLPDFALLLGVSPVTVWRWEKGEISPEGATRVLLELMRDHRRETTKLLWKRASRILNGKGRR
jgi:DNA-binding transcriptional regulator YiaG